MKLQTLSRFLTDGSAQLDMSGGDVVAVGIHPSSEVCLVDVNGTTLGVGSIVPVGGGGTQLRAIHHPLSGDQLVGAGNNLVVADGESEFVGDKLVLQLYAKCDALMPPGHRLPFYKDVLVPAASLPTTADDAMIAFRVPFHGRAGAAVSFFRTTNHELNVSIVGRSYGRRNPVSSLVKSLPAFADSEGRWVEPSTTETYFNGGGTAPTKTIQTTEQRWRTVYVGGLGDTCESFDELVVYVWGPAGGAAYLTCEAYGERL